MIGGQTGLTGPRLMRPLPSRSPMVAGCPRAEKPKQVSCRHATGSRNWARIAIATARKKYAGRQRNPCLLLWAPDRGPGPPAQPTSVALRFWPDQQGPGTGTGGGMGAEKNDSG